MEKPFKMTALTLAGLEGVLADELRKLGGQEVAEGYRNITFKGDKGFMYKANIALRTAIRILKNIKKAKVFNQDDLYEVVKSINWERYLDADSSFAVSATVNSKNFTSNSHYISLKTKDAIADYFMHKYKKRPSVDLKYPDLKVHIHINNQWLGVYLDSSGNSLHKRGYRSATNIAPINEVLAAGLLLLSGYSGQENFIDPMCGSGTFLVEAAMIANNIPANINRKHFAFENWKDYDKDLYFVIQDSLLKKLHNSHFKILGFDKAPSAVSKAKQNIANAQLNDFAKVYNIDFFCSKKEVFGKTLIVFNPPYGERLKVSVKDFYQKIGNTLKHNYTDTTAWLISADSQALKYVGLRSSKRIQLKNGNLQCCFAKYELYEGSKKIKIKS
ncbi:MAG: class I SAM-dependent RNA methyltransferase [Tenacibaculum sp.]